MSVHRERLALGSSASEHVVQFFDETESLVVTLGGYLADGWRRGDNLLVLARPRHWALAAGELAARGCPVVDWIAEGRLVALDAMTMMGTFIVNGQPDAAKFQASIGEIVGRLAGDGAGLTAYGEIVDVLAAQGNLAGAEQVEALWNELGARWPFRLMCGYSSANFGDERTAADFNAVCTAHATAHARGADLLASWLLANRRARYHLETS